MNLKDAVQNVIAYSKRLAASVTYVDSKVTDLTTTVEDIKSNGLTLDSLEPRLLEMGIIDNPSNSKLFMFPDAKSSIIIRLEDFGVFNRFDYLEFHAVVRNTTPDGVHTYDMAMESYGNYTTNNVPTSYFGRIYLSVNYGHSVAIELKHITGHLPSECKVSDISDYPSFFQHDLESRLRQTQKIVGLRVKLMSPANALMTGRWSIYG